VKKHFWDVLDGSLTELSQTVENVFHDRVKTGNIFQIMSYRAYTVEEKQRIINGVVPGSRTAGFRQTAKRFGVRGGKSLVSRWFAHKDELGDKRQCHKSSALTTEERALHIRDFVLDANARGEVVNYNDVKCNVEKKTGKSLSKRRLNQIGATEFGLTFKRSKLTLRQDGRRIQPRVAAFQGLEAEAMAFSSPLVAETAAYKTEVRQFRQKCHQLKACELVFLDQTNMKEEPQPLHGLAPKGKAAKSSSPKREAYKARVDFCAAISLHGPLCCSSTTPEMRKLEEVRGYTKQLILEWLNEELSQSLQAMAPHKIVVCMDKGLKITKEEVMEELEKGGATNVQDALIMPTNAGKLANPLDNAMWADVKRRVRELKPKLPNEVAEIFEQEFMSTPSAKIKGWYRKAGVLPGSNINRDL